MSLGKLLLVPSIALFFCACERTSTPTGETPPAEEQESESTTVEPEPAPEPIECPERSITIDGEPYPVASALAYRGMQNGEVAWQRVMLTDEDINCSAIVDHEYTPRSYVTTYIQTGLPDAGMVYVRGGRQRTAGLGIARTTAVAGEEISMCVHEPVTVTDRDEREITLVGLVAGRFCGDF